MPKCLLAITGSVAAVKSPEIIRALQVEGFEVHCIITKAGERFAAPDALAAISGNPVLNNSYFSDELPPLTRAIPEFPHIDLANEIDLLLIAPASADTLARIRVGRADGIFETICLMGKVPTLIAPAMNTEMLESIATQENIQILEKRGIEILPTETGVLACGAMGEGRILSSSIISYYAKRKISPQAFFGKKIVVTMGGTQEYLDPVRYVGNRSSGKMGLAIALEAFFMGANVTIISGKTKEEFSQLLGKENTFLEHQFLFSNVEFVTSTQEMLHATKKYISGIDIVFFSAAAADFTPRNFSEGKISSDAELNLFLQKTADIAAICGKEKKKHQKFYGFALQTEEKISAQKKAEEKMKQKNFDGICLNTVKNLGSDVGSITFFSQSGEAHKISGKKREIAKELLLKIKKNETFS